MKQQHKIKYGTKVSWKNDRELFQLIRKELYTAVVGDIMDKLGLIHQFLPPQIKPLRSDMFVTGRAMTVLEADVIEPGTDISRNPVLNRPFGLMLEALDDLKTDEVYTCTGASPNYALWGELMSARAMNLGAAGAVIDGYARDTHGILKLNFPVFSFGSYAQDQSPRGKVIDYRIPIEIKGVRINSGDIIIGDVDGVCIVPKNAEAEIFHKAIDKAREEKMIQKKISEGMSALEAFEKYGIL
ncbi:MAG: RraA family protein [Ginsengibacter sp.]